MSQPEKRTPDQHAAWTRPQVKRLWTGWAAGASNGGQDFGFGQS